MMPAALHIAALLAYVIASVLYGANIALKNPYYVQRGRIAFALGVGLHTAAIGAFCLAVRQSPFANAYGMLSVAAWAVALVGLPVEALGRIPALGALAAPVSATLLFGALARVRSAAASVEVPSDIRSRVISLHVLLVLFSFALFALAACCAVFYVWQYALLKRPDSRQHALFRRLPPLETADSLAFHLVALALPLLTLGLILGIVRAMGSVSTSSAWYADVYTIMSFVAWAVYGLYLVTRLAAGWRGTRLNYLLIAGFVLTLALYFLPSTTHRFS